jgi:hypothetical protein
MPRDRLPRDRDRAGVAAVGLVLLVLLSLVACSASAAGGETPQSTLAAFYHALGARDSAGACALVAYNGRPLAGNDVLLCQTGFDTIIKDVATPDELASLTTASVAGAAVDGDNATISADQLTGVPAAYREDVSLVRVGGRWYIESPL